MEKDSVPEVACFYISQESRNVERSRKRRSPFFQLTCHVSVVTTSTHKYIRLMKLEQESSHLLQEGRKSDL